MIDRRTQEILFFVRGGDLVGARQYSMRIPNHLRMGVARNLLTDGDWEVARQVLADHTLKTEHPSYVEIEWFLGFVDYVFLHNATLAAQRWRGLTCQATSPEWQAKLCYWLGRVLNDGGPTDEAACWLHFASIFSTTFYGQLAQLEVIRAKGSEVAKHRIAHSATFWNPHTPQQKPLLDKAVEEIMVQLNQMPKKGAKALHRSFIEREAKAKNYLEKLALLKAAYFISAPSAYALYGKLFNAYQIPSFLGYPLLDQVVPQSSLGAIFKVVDPARRHWAMALAHAMVRRESHFKTNAHSVAGAHGLMQLRPGTAQDALQNVLKQTGGSAGSAADKAGLIDNLLLGASHAQTLAKRFGQHTPLVAAAYNAGAHNVQKWIAIWGNPLSNEVDMVTWIELIPFRETRQYVQEVQADFVVYTALLNVEYLQGELWPLF